MAKKKIKKGPNLTKVLREDLPFWMKKWRVSGLQIGGAKRALQSDSVSKIEKYFRGKGLIK
jgi:hypothetical protein